MKSLLPVSVAALLALGPGALAAQPGAAFPVARPDRGEVVRHVTLPGTIQPYQQATLHAKVAGYLKSIAVDRGDAVTAGQPLAEIEAPELAADLARYQAEFTLARIESDRAGEARRSAPDLVLPQAIDQALGRLEIARAQVERIETLLAYARLTAPFAGIITARHVDPGAFIPAATGGAMQAAALVTLMDFTTVRVRFAVPELEAGRVRGGQPLAFVADVVPGRGYEAKVSRLGYALDPGTQTMLVEADVPNADLALRPGMFVTARLGVEVHAGVLRVPADAVLVERAGASVFTLDGGRAKKTPVKTGFNDGAHIEIAGGFDAGATVIRLGKTPIADGQAVAVRP